MVSSGDLDTNEKKCKGAKLGPTSECDTGKCARGRCAGRKKNPKKGLGFFARSQTKAHILRDQLAPVVEQEEEDEDEVFMEQKGEDLECDHDSDYASDCDDEVSSECSDLDII